MAAGNRKAARHLGLVLALITGLALYLPSTASRGKCHRRQHRAVLRPERLRLDQLLPQPRRAGRGGPQSHVRSSGKHACEVPGQPLAELRDQRARRTGHPGGQLRGQPVRHRGGKAAANNSNITRVNAEVPDRVAVTNWFVSAFHALTLLDPRLRSTGYAAYYTSSPTGAQPDAFKFTAGRTSTAAGPAATTARRWPSRPPVPRPRCCPTRSAPSRRSRSAPR